MTVPYTPPKITINARRCQACGACADACIGGAVDIQRNAVSYDENLCIICGNCYDFFFDEECPTGAFSVDVEAR